MRRRDLLLRSATLGAGLVLNPSLAHLEPSYPSGPIRLIVPYPPAGVVDVVARAWAEKMKQVLGTIVVENQPGGGGTLGASTIARAKPDGYNLLFGETSCLIISPYLMARSPYDPTRDFEPASMFATSSTSVVINPSVPAKTLEEFIAYVKTNEDKVSYGSAGVGTVTHLAGESFKQLINAPKLLHVPYRGAALALTDVIGGTIPMATPNINNQILEFHRAGKIRILAICAPDRIKAAPEIPAAREILPGLVIQLTAGIVAPAGTPEAIISRLAMATAALVKDPAFQAVLETSGLEGRADVSPTGARAFIRAEREHLIPIMKTAGLVPQ